MEGAALDSSFSWIPAPHLLLAYSIFFAYGWLLYGQRQKVNMFQHHWRVYLVSGLAVFTLYFFAAIAPPFTELSQAYLPAKALAALVIWLMIFASIGFFERFLSKPNLLVRYLSDASYWMYLIHLPVVLVLVKLVAPLPLSAFIKFTIVLSGTLFFSLLTYYLFVRSTAIGALLSGRKYPRSLPIVKEEPQPAAV
jgi:glucan biosynthesis protein C